MKPEVVYEDEYDKIVRLVKKESKSYVEVALNKENGKCVISFMLESDGEYLNIMSMNASKSNGVTATTVIEKAMTLLSSELEKWS